MKILLIDDDDAVRNTLFEVLKFEDHTVDEAADVEEALAKLPGDYDLVISDILLKTLSGIALLERVNQMERRVPVVMITGFGGAELEKKCREKGAVGFLHKPFSVQAFLDLVAKLGKSEH